VIRHLEPYISAASELIITMERALAALPELARRFETYSSALLFDGIPQYLLYEEAAKQVLRVKMATYLTSHHKLVCTWIDARQQHVTCLAASSDLLSRPNGDTASVVWWFHPRPIVVASPVFWKLLTVTRFGTCPGHSGDVHGRGRR
jgi:hypothetical protein